MPQQDIVSGLFGLSPYQIQQGQNKQQDDFAFRMSSMQGPQLSQYLAGRAGGMAADVGAGMMGMVNPQVQEAQMTEAALSGLDMNDPQSILERAGQIQDPRLKIKLTMMAQQRAAAIQKAELDAAKTERELAIANRAAMGEPEGKYAPEVIKLMAIRDKLPEGDPRRAEIEAAIRKITYIKPEKAVGGGGAGGVAEKPVKLTKGQEAVDRNYSKDYVDWKAGGGYADVEKQLQQLDQVSSELGKKGNDYTGPAVGLIPDKARSFTNPEAVAAKNKVEEVAQRNLRLVLGAQFTQVEGERLIARAYNPQLPPSENKARVDALTNQIRLAAQAKEDAAQYFEENGTLTGWKGRIPTLADFDKAIDNAVKTKEASGKIGEKRVDTTSGLPAGSKLIGTTPDGKMKVYQSPDGKKWTE